LPPSRLQSLQARFFPHGVLDVVRQVALFFAAYYAYRIVRGAIDGPTGAAVAFEHGRQLISVERGMHLFIEPTVQAWASSKPAIIDAASWLYINAQTTVTVGCLMFLYLFHNERFYYVRNMFMVAMFLALVGYVLYPTAPPRFFPEWGFHDAVSQFVGVDDNSKVNALFNPYAAVPSMHVCFSMMIGLSMARVMRTRTMTYVWRIYPALVFFVIVATGNHFVADAFLGACTAGMSAYAAQWLARARPAVWAFTPQRAAA
jgi:hypothetical protein